MKKGMKKNVIQVVISSIFTIFLLLGCKPNYQEIEDINFKKEIYYLLDRSDFLKKNEYTIFRMDTLTDFKWDKMYVFSNISEDTMNKELGFDWDYSMDMGMLQERDKMIVFVKNNKVVSTSYFNDDNDDGGLREWDFTLGNKRPFSTSNDSIFYIDKDYGTNGYNFNIFQLEYENEHIKEQVLKKEYVAFKN
jgi:hypothetical protein